MTPIKQHAITGFVLAGGESRRMGADKVSLQLGDETLLARAIKLCSSVCSSVSVAGSAARFASQGQVVEDIFPKRGPLGGIHAALNSSATELNLILAVDLPFIEVGFLKYLVARAEKSEAIVTVAHSGGKWQPLCAIYRKSFADGAEAALIQRKNKVDALFTSVQLEVIREAEISRAGFSPSMLRNLNTPEDWEWAQRQV